METPFQRRVSSPPPLAGVGKERRIVRRESEKEAALLYDDGAGHQMQCVLLACCGLKQIFSLLQAGQRGAMPNQARRGLWVRVGLIAESADR
ncbi:hypothetical protein CPSG_03331 [Coccidioides posadasii str. Silveira]|uniref:Uncharacterized protein n=1 Tax=Coccidioides posadasii (strain RMSCC 757 / Silveira) TaxID=443226 RepID=E9CZQ3_COCPS|nr:hypothetical protein CPSG_03331 [Coccidioides posadasii str. Silveira]